MHSFFDLVGFEYKKIFKRKSSIIAIIIVTILSTIGPMLNLIGNVYVDGKPFETAYQAMIKDRDYAKALSGRSIDEMLILELKEQYSKIPPVGSNQSYVGLSEYQEYARPYSKIYNILYTVYGNEHRLMQNLSQEQIENFYQLRHDEVSDRINAMNISNNSKDKLIKLDSQIKTPFVFDYTDAYQDFLSMLYTTGVFAAFAISVCLAPMFAGEYGARTDQLILSSKFGKNKIISAKLFVGISFCVGLILILTIITFLVCLGITGFDGATAPIQLWYSLFIYPFTMWQVAIIYSLCVLFAVILVSAITLLLSSIFKSPFPVIIITSLMIFVPMMINIPQNTLLLNLFRLLPTTMMSVSAILVNYTPYELFGLLIKPHVFLPVFATISSVALLPFAYRSFKNHQVS